MKPSLRIAAAVLVLLGAASPAAADPTRCTAGDRPVNAEIETSLGTIGLCLIDDDREDPSPARDMALITRDFQRAARRGDFDNSFFHLADHCPDWEGGDCFWPASKIHGGSFQLSEAAISELPDWSPTEGESVLQNSLGTIAVVIDNGELSAEWLINVEDNSNELDQPRQAHPFGVVVEGFDVVYAIANLNTLDTSSSPSTVNVRLSESGCLSGDVPGALETCPCDGDGDPATAGDSSCVDCVAATGYRASVDEPELRVRDDGVEEPCINGDQEFEESCVCSEDDKLEGEPCENSFEAYVEGSDFLVRDDGETEPCISGDQEPEESCICSDDDELDGTCIDAAGYPETLPSLWVRKPQEAPCLSGDDFYDSCPCSQAEKDAGTCVTVETYFDALPGLWVRDDGLSDPCISGDEFLDDEECSCSDDDEVDGTCIDAEDYLDDLSDLELSVRDDDDDVPDVCIVGDQDAGDELCNCTPLVPDGADPCVSYEIYRGSQTCDLWVRMDDESGPCLTGGDCWEDLPTSCEPCSSADRDCVAAEDYPASLVDVWVRLATPACISGDGGIDTCICSPEDRGEEGPCVPFDDYVASFDETPYVSRPHPACLSGDVVAPVVDSTICRSIDLAAGRCMPADYYLAFFSDSQLWVREDGTGDEPCINGDDDEATETCACTEGDKQPGGICDEFEDHVGQFAAEVRARIDACVSGDEDAAAETCECAEPDTCVAAETYLDTRPDLWVRQDGQTEPCISGDEDVETDSCECAEDDKQPGGICDTFEDYTDDFPAPANTLALYVRLDLDPCLSGDAGEAEGSCACLDADIIGGICIEAGSYPATLPPETDLWVRDDGVNQPCISGDQEGILEICECTEDDKLEGGICVDFDEYVASSTPRQGLFVRLAVLACLSGDAGEARGTCVCSEADIAGGICIAAEDYRDSFPLDWIELGSGGEALCISGDDVDADETCICSSADKQDPETCESAEDFLARFSAEDLLVRSAVEPCFGTDDIEDDDSCVCAEADGGCESANDYLDGILPPGRHFEDLPIDPSNSYPSILDLNSSGLVMIWSVPEPASIWLQAGSVLTLTLLARVRSRRR